MDEDAGVRRLAIHRSCCNSIAIVSSYCLLKANNQALSLGAQEATLESIHGLRIVGHRRMTFVRRNWLQPKYSNLAQFHIKVGLKRLTLETMGHLLLTFVF